MKRAGRDEQNVVRSHHAVLRVDGCSLDDRQNVALNTLAAHLRTMRAFASCDLVDFVDEDDSALFDTLDSRLRHALHVDQLLFLFLREKFQCLGHFHPPLACLPLKEPRQHVLQIDVDFFNR